MLHTTWRLTTRGGVPAVVRTLLNTCEPDVVDAHLLSVRPAAAEDVAGLSRHITVHSLDYTGPHTRRARLRLAAASAMTVRAIAPDVLHTHSGSAWMSLPTRVTSPSTVQLLDVHDAPFTRRHGLGTDLGEMTMLRLFGYHPVAHSTSVRDDTARAARLTAGRIPVIPLGVEARVPDAAAGRRFRETHDIPQTDKLVLYTGSAPSKNVQLFLDVAADVLASTKASVTFVLISSATVRCDHAGVRVLPPQPSLYPALEAADLFLSTADYEGFGLAITEAMQTGVPVVCTDVGGVRDQVRHGRTGLLAPAQDRAGLARAARSLLEDDERRTAMGQKARAHVADNLTTARVARDFEQLYLDLCGRAAHRRPAVSRDRMDTVGRP